MRDEEDNTFDEEDSEDEEEDKPFDKEEDSEDEEKVAYMFEESVDNTKILDECERILTAMTALYETLPLTIADPQPRRNLEEAYKFMTRCHARLGSSTRVQTQANADSGPSSRTKTPTMDHEDPDIDIPF